MDKTNIAQLQNQLTLARREIQNLRQQLSTLTHIHKKEIKNIHLQLDNWQCVGCRNKNEAANSSEHASTDGFSNEYSFKPIGIINTHFPEKRGTPRQPGICKDSIAKLTLSKNIFTNPQHALEGLQEFSHMWVMFYFHKNDISHIRAKVAPPRLNGIRTGVFATRSPHRPCPIGLSLVKIDHIMDNVIYFRGVDMVDQTPVFDIKPYIPQYDSPGLGDNMNVKWIDNAEAVAHSNMIVEDFEIACPDNIPEGRVIDVPSPSTREMDGQENGRETQVGETVGSNGSSTFLRSSSRIGEREAPDGEEEESSITPSVANTVPAANQQRNTLSSPSTSAGHVRVPSWIDQAPIPTLNVSFKERAISQLQELGTEGEEKKRIITNVLQEDPRSVYLRERWGGHCYVFRIAKLYVSCKFNDANQTVIVYQIFQNERQAEGDE